MARKNAAAVALGRKGGMKGGPARAAKLTPEQRSESARKAVRARWAKTRPAVKTPKEAVMSTGKQIIKTTPGSAIDTSDNALANLLKRLRTTADRNEIRHLADQIERVIFHKQFMNA